MWSPRRNRVNGRDCTGERTQGCVFSRAAPFRLTIASVVILPSTLIAGVLGMNFHPAFFDSPNLFWAILGLMALLICATLAAARRMRWI